MTLPGKDDIVALHDAQIRRCGGAPGTRDDALLESALGRVRSAAGYAELDTIAAAAMLCHAILKNHVFVDGNKRTAYGALVMTLAGDGLRIEEENEEIVTAVMRAAAGPDGHSIRRRITSTS